MSFGGEKDLYVRDGALTTLQPEGVGGFWDLQLLQQSGGGS